MELKIFELRNDDEKEWIAATHVLQAIRCYNEITELEDLSDDAEIVEIPKEQWSELFVRNHEDCQLAGLEWESKSFADFVKEDGGTPPYIIAGSFYD